MRWWLTDCGDCTRRRRRQAERMQRKMRRSGDVTVDRRAAGGAGGSARALAEIPAWTARMMMRIASARWRHAGAEGDSRQVVGIGTDSGSGTGAVVG